MSRTLSVIYRGGLFLSIGLLLAGLVISRMGGKNAGVISEAGVILLLATPLAGLSYLAAAGLKRKEMKIALYAFALLILIGAAVILLRGIR
ncbi:MAG: hypothetical protein D6713_07260 [Deltaproteobacteria bacterium]|nr:MAG: hypothetical protein D6713_07260 [Deltaproteobacteria bacterium]